MSIIDPVSNQRFCIFENNGRGAIYLFINLSIPNKKNPDGPSLYCAVIVKKVDEKTRSKTSINDLLRD